MLNKVSLYFQDPQDEKQYILDTKSKILNEFGAFALLTIAYCLLQMISFLGGGNFILAVVCVLAIVFTFMAYRMIRQLPQRLNIILLIYQVITAFVYEFNQFVGSKDKVSLQYTWFYGFQCSFFHFCIYLQGSKYILQSMALFLAFSFHLVNYLNFDQAGVLNSIIYYWIFFSMMVLRYVFENEKRQTFIYQREQSKWNQVQHMFIKLVDKTVSNWMVMISYNHHQNLLGMISCNESLKEYFNIKDDMDIRLLFRKIEIKNKTETKNERINLEKLLTDLFIKQSGSKNIDDRTDGFIKFTGKLISYQMNMVVKVFKYVRQNEIVFLVVLDAKTEQVQMKVLERKCFVLENLLGDFIENMKPQMQAIQTLYLKLQISMNEVSKKLLRSQSNFYEKFNSIINLQYLTYTASVDSPKRLISGKNLLKHLQIIFGINQLQVELIYVDNEASRTLLDFEKSIQVLLSLIFFFLNANKSFLKQFKIICWQRNDSTKFKLIFSDSTIDDQYLDMIKAIKTISRNNQLLNSHYCSQGKMIHDFWRAKKKLIYSSTKNPYLEVLRLIVSLNILSSISPDNYFRVKRDILNDKVEVHFRIFNTNGENQGSTKKND